MAASVVQHGVGPGNQGAVVSTALNTVNGSNCLIFAVVSFPIGGITISDNAASHYTWTPLVTDANNRSQLFVGVGGSGGNVTVNGTASTFFNVAGSALYEVTLANTSAVGSWPVVSAVGSSPTPTGTITPAATGDLVLFNVAGSSGSVGTPGGAWTFVGFDPATPGFFGGGAYQQGVAGTPLTATFSAGSGPWDVVGVDIPGVPTPAILPTQNVVSSAVRRSASRMERAASGLFRPRERERIVIPQLVLARG